MRRVLLTVSAVFAAALPVMPAHGTHEWTTKQVTAPFEEPSVLSDCDPPTLGTHDEHLEATVEGDVSIAMEVRTAGNGLLPDSSACWAQVTYGFTHNMAEPASYLDIGVTADLKEAFGGAPNRLASLGQINNRARLEMNVFAFHLGCRCTSGGNAVLVESTDGGRAVDPAAVWVSAQFWAGEGIPSGDVLIQVGIRARVGVGQPVPDGGYATILADLTLRSLWITEGR